MKARRLPKYVVFVGLNRHVEDFYRKSDAELYAMPTCGDRIGRVTWEPARKSKQRKKVA